MNWDTIWTVVSIIFILVVGAIEGIALLTRNMENTLSSKLRKWFGIEPARWWRWLSVPAFIGFLIWFGYHIVWER